MGNLADAEDATSETFFKAMKNIGRFRWRGGGFLPWLYRIAANEVTNIQRKRKKGIANQLLEHLPAPVRDELEEAETAREGQELFGSLKRALSLLDPRDQEIVLLHYFQGESYSLIAKATGVKESTVRVKAMRALRRLKESLGKEGWNHGKVREAEWAGALSGSSAEISELSEAGVGI